MPHPLLHVTAKYFLIEPFWKTQSLTWTDRFKSSLVYSGSVLLELVYCPWYVSLTPEDIKPHTMFDDRNCATTQCGSTGIHQSGAHYIITNTTDQLTVHSARMEHFTEAPQAADSPVNSFQSTMCFFSSWHIWIRHFLYFCIYICSSGMYIALKSVCMSTMLTVSGGNKVTLATAGLLILCFTYSYQCQLVTTADFQS